jgi:hypothetical protein
MGASGAVDPQQVRELVESTVFEELGPDAAAGLVLMARWGTLDARAVPQSHEAPTGDRDSQGLVRSA